MSTPVFPAGFATKLWHATGGHVDEQLYASSRVKEVSSSAGPAKLEILVLDFQRHCKGVLCPHTATKPDIWPCSQQGPLVLPGFPLRGVPLRGANKNNPTAPVVGRGVGRAKKKYSQALETATLPARRRGTEAGAGAVYPQLHSGGP